MEVPSNAICKIWQKSGVRGMPFCDGNCGYRHSAVPFKQNSPVKNLTMFTVKIKNILIKTKFK